ncbi:MAG: ATP-binding protein [Actinobacteria bacterium]|nr:ATP-binding protein [Actinomycetota bacterium]
MEIGPAVTVTDPSQVSEARRVAAALAHDLQFNEETSGRVAIVVTEIATNVLKHGGGGEILFRPVRSGTAGAIDILALDRGNGMANVQESLRDGHSTSGSPGTGLGAIRRLSDSFDIYSIPGQGTAVFSRLWSVPSERSNVLSITVGGTCRPNVGEDVCGDGWAVEQGPRRTLILVVDGLGHGPVAAEASREAIRLFHVNASFGPAAMIEVIHAGLRSTRGAAAAVTEIDPDDRVVRFSGVGNISEVIVTPGGQRQMVSYNGILGHTARKVVEFSYPWSHDAVLVGHTDGLASHWDLDRYPGLVTRMPSVIAGVLQRDFRRGRDDVTVVVARALTP